MASTIKVDNVQNQPGTNIVSKCGTDVTIGASGDTVALACGASQTGFGRTGTVDWVTTPKVTGDSPVTAATGSGYFLNTTAGTITINLPAGAAGSIVSVADYAGTWQTNAVTVAANGTEKIGGVDADVTLNTEGQSVTFVYVDSTQGWLNIMDSTSNVRGNAFIVATGGTPCTGAVVCTNYKTHTFTGPGTFIVTNAGAAPGSNTVDYLVLAGGGAGGGRYGGGGGAGGFRESPGAASGCYTTSPRGVGPAAALSVPATPYPIAVGGGGTGVPSTPGDAAGGDGSVSTFSTITSTGGGGGAGQGLDGADGGSGGGGSYNASGGAGNTPSAPVAQGMNGGDGHTPGSPYATGGGGGATEVGQNAVPSPSTGGRGGAGATTCISASPVAYAGGGGGSGEGSHGIDAGAASPCGTGTAGAASNTNSGNGAVNKGGGTGGAFYPGPSSSSGTGGSGVVIIRYKFQ